MKMIEKEVAVMVKFLTSTLKEVKEFASKKTPGLIKDILEDAIRRCYFQIATLSFFVFSLVVGIFVIYVNGKQRYHDGSESLQGEEICGIVLLGFIIACIIYSITESVLNLLEAKRNPRSYLLGVVKGMTESNDE